MSQQQFESEVKHIEFSQQRVYDKLKDMSGLEQYKSLLDGLSKDGISLDDFHFDADTASCMLRPVGRVELRIVEREEPKCIKFEATTSPIPLTLWIQIVPTAEEACKIKVTLRTELNFFLKGMLQKPLKEGVDKLAKAITQIPY